MPETPMSTISSAAMTSVASVSPEIGLFDEPIRPTRLPETAAKKKPMMIITMAATMPPLQHAGIAGIENDHAEQHDCQAAEYDLAFRSRSVRAVPACAAADFFRSETARAMPKPRLLRMRNSV